MMSSVTGDGLPIMCFAKLRACFFGPLISCHESWGDRSLSVSLTVKWAYTLSCHKWVLDGLSGWSGILDLLIILLLRPAGRHLSESLPHSLTKFISVQLHCCTNSLKKEFCWTAITGICWHIIPKDDKPTHSSVIPKLSWVAVGL